MDFGWRPGIGDPTLAGWLTVIFYLAAAASACVVARMLSGKVPDHGREILVWRVLVGLLLFLGINKQLDLQSALTEVGRYLAHRQGWYEQRQSVQLIFVGGVVLAGVLTALASVVLLRGLPNQTWIALFGTALVLTFVVIRAASFHHVDAFISARLANIRWNAILEIGGLAFVLLGAWLRIHAERKQAPSVASPQRI